MLEGLVAIGVVLGLLGAVLLWRSQRRRKADWVEGVLGLGVNTSGRREVTSERLEATVRFALETYSEAVKFPLVPAPIYEGWRIEFEKGLGYHGTFVPWAKLIRINIGEHFGSRWPKVLAHELGHLFRYAHTGGYDRDEHHAFFERSGLEAKWGTFRP